MVIFDHGLVGV